MLMINSFLSSFPLHFYLAVSAASSGVSSLHSWCIHNGLVLNPTKTEVICFGTSPQLQSLSHVTSIEAAGTSVSLVLGVTFDKHLNFDKHISNVCFSPYFHIHALRHIRPFLDSETSKTIAGAIVSSRLDCKFHSYGHFFSQYPSSSSRSNTLAQVITHSITKPPQF